MSDLPVGPGPNHLGPVQLPDPLATAVQQALDAVRAEREVWKRDYAQLQEHIRTLQRHITMLEDYEHVSTNLLAAITDEMNRRRYSRTGTSVELLSEWRERLAALVERRGP